MPESSFSFQVSKKLLDHVSQLWQRSEAASLKTRHAVGLLLVKNLARTQQNKRQPYGRRLVLKVAERLGVSESEVSRMRKFARLFKSFKDFSTKHPKVHTWSEVKSGVLTAKKRKSAKTSANHSDPVRLPVRALTKATERLKSLDQTFQPDSDEWRRVRDALAELTQAASSVLGSDWANEWTIGPKVTAKVA
jgi:hypothetical protein